MSKSLKQIMDELHQEDPWYMDTYWSIYRFFRWHKVFHPIEMYREVKYFIQRGRRGWSDRDAWSLDYYLTSWMPEALGYIRKHKHGVPIDMYDAKDVNDYGNPSKDGQAADRIARPRALRIIRETIDAVLCYSRTSKSLPACFKD